jgi:hypothetical protein
MYSRRTKQNADHFGREQVQQAATPSLFDSLVGACSTAGNTATRAALRWGWAGADVGWAGSHQPARLPPEDVDEQ